MNIAHKKINTTTKRINRITATFKRSKKADQARILDRLSYEASSIQDEAVKNWLVRFETTLRHLGGK